ncbi:hypothetical protein V8E54_012416 [Elaphomyces granulatus]
MALTMITKGFRDDISNAAPLNTGPTVPLDAEFIDLTGCGDEPITPLQGSRLNLELHQSVPPLYADESLNRIWDEMFLPEYLSPGPEQKKSGFPPYGWPETQDNIDFSAQNTVPVSSNSNSTVSSTSPSPDDTAASEDINLGKVLEVFPDISYDYVNELFTIEKERPQPPDVVTDITERIIEEILHQLPYPKQKDLKRKRNASEPDANEPRWEIGPDDANDPVYSHRAIKILMHEFPLVPAQHIRSLVENQKTLFAAYMTLKKSEVLFQTDGRAPYERLRKPRRSSTALFHLKNPATERELKAAIKAASKEIDSERQQKEADDAERRNEEEHVKIGAVIECQCCFSDTPTNRTIPCEGDSIHFFCHRCIKLNAESQIGLMKYEMKCLDISGCKACFSRESLVAAIGLSVMAKLDSLQQQDEIVKAGLDGLEDCPFCEFKAICPPPEEDREFRCLNPDCEKVSCRLCKQETHIPKSCKEAQKEAGVPERHLVEEAMTEALVRTCPRCKVKIVKESGCNKLICSKCRCSMCYICQQDITNVGYEHFKEGSGGCQVYDRGVDRQQEEINHAQQIAIQKITTENPHLNQEELRVKLPNDSKNGRNQKEARRPPQVNFPRRRNIHNIRNPPPPMAPNPEPYQNPVPVRPPPLYPEFQVPVRSEYPNFVPLSNVFAPQIELTPQVLETAHHPLLIRPNVTNPAYFPEPEAQVANHDFHNYLLHHHGHQHLPHTHLFQPPVHTNLHNQNVFEASRVPPRHYMMNYLDDFHA